MITFCLAQPSDGASLAEIYKYYVENTSITFEYVAPSDEEFSERIRQKSENYPFIVALDNEKPVGYAYASLYRDFADCKNNSYTASQYDHIRHVKTKLEYFTAKDIAKPRKR